MSFRFIVYSLSIKNRKNSIVLIPHDDTESDWKKTDPIQNITIATGSMTLMINIGDQTKKTKNLERLLHKMNVY